MKRSHRITAVLLASTGLALGAVSAHADTTAAGGAGHAMSGMGHAKMAGMAQRHQQAMGGAGHGRMGRAGHGAQQPGQGGAAGTPQASGGCPMGGQHSAQAGHTH